MKLNLFFSTRKHGKESLLAVSSNHAVYGGRVQGGKDATISTQSCFAQACPGGCFVLGSGSRVFNSRLMENRFNKNFLSLCAQMQLQADIMLHRDHNGSCNAKGKRKDLHPRRGCTQGSREARLITLRQKQGLEWKKEEGEVRGNIKPSVCQLHDFEQRSG